MSQAAITFNPGKQTNFPGKFSASTSGFMQGDALDGPAERTYLRKGLWNPNNTVPAWGGLAINEAPAVGTGGPLGSSPPPSAQLQALLAPATTITAAQAGTYRGFSSFQQSTKLIQTAQSRVPQAGGGMGINFYRSGSGARIVVQSLAAARAAWLAGGVFDAAVYWDTVNLWVTNAAGANIIGPLPGVSLDTIPVTDNSYVVNMTEYLTGDGYLNWAIGSAVVLKI